MNFRFLRSVPTLDPKNKVRLRSSLAICYLASDQTLSTYMNNYLKIVEKNLTIALSKRMDYTKIADMIHNLIQNLSHSLSLCFFDDVLLSVVNNKKNKKMKQLLIEYSNYVDGATYVTFFSTSTMVLMLFVARRIFDECTTNVHILLFQVVVDLQRIN